MNAVQQEHLIQLAQILETHFNVQELKKLCFYLGIDYDDLPDEGRANKAIQLVSYCNRHNRIRDLINTGKRLRPEIRWPGGPQDISRRLSPQIVLGLIILGLIFLVTIGVIILRPPDPTKAQEAVQRIDAAINGGDPSITSFSPSPTEKQYFDFVRGTKIARDVFDGSNVPLFREFFDNGRLTAKDYFDCANRQCQKIRTYFDKNDREFLRDTFTQFGQLIRKEQYANGQWIQRAAAFQSPLPPAFLAFVYR